MICFDEVVAVLLGEMAGSGHQLVKHARIGRCFVRGHRARVGALIESLSLNATVRIHHAHFPKPAATASASPKP